MKHRTTLKPYFSEHSKQPVLSSLSISTICLFSDYLGHVGQCWWSHLEHWQWAQQRVWWKRRHWKGGRGSAVLRRKEYELVTSIQEKMFHESHRLYVKIKFCFKQCIFFFFLMFPPKMTNTLSNTKWDTSALKHWSWSGPVHVTGLGIDCFYVAQSLTKTQNEFVLGHHGDNFWSLEIVKQHFQAEQLDGGEGGWHLDAGVQTHPRRTGRATKSWGAWRCQTRHVSSFVLMCVNAGKCRPKIWHPDQEVKRRIWDFENPKWLLLSFYHCIHYIT